MNLCDTKPCNSEPAERPHRDWKDFRRFRAKTNCDAVRVSPAGRTAGFLETECLLFLSYKLNPI